MQVTEAAAEMLKGCAFKKKQRLLLPEASAEALETAPHAPPLATVQEALKIGPLSTGGEEKKSAAPPAQLTVTVSPGAGGEGSVWLVGRATGAGRAGGAAGGFREPFREPPQPPLQPRLPSPNPPRTRVERLPAGGGGLR